MKSNLIFAIFTGCIVVESSAQVVLAPPPRDFSTHIATKGRVPETSGRIAAIALAERNSCKYSINGKKFHRIRAHTEIPEGAVVRTGRTGSTDLFLKRMGATIRLRPNTEIQLQRTEYSARDEKIEMKGAVEVRKGTLLAVVHANVPGSALTMRNAAGQKIAEPISGARYIVSADSIKDVSLQKLPAGADDSFSPQMTAAINQQMEFDEIQALAESWTDPKNGSLE